MIFDKIHILFILSNIYESTNGVSKKYIKFIQFLSQQSTSFSYPLSISILLTKSNSNQEPFPTLPNVSFHSCKGLRIPYYPEIKVPIPSYSLIHSLIHPKNQIIIFNGEFIWLYDSMEKIKRKYPSTILLPNYHTDYEYYIQNVYTIFRFSSSFLHKMESLLQQNIFYGIIVTGKTMIEKYKHFTPNLFNANELDLSIYHKPKYDTYYSKKINLIYTGRISHEKNINLLFPLLKEASKSFQCTLHFIGDGPQLQELKQFTKKEYSKYKIIFHGKQSSHQIYQLYLKLENRFFLFPSCSETFGKSPLEACASGIPLFILKSNASSFIYQHLQNAFIFETKEEFIQYLHMFYDWNQQKKKEFLLQTVQNCIPYEQNKIFTDWYQFLLQSILPKPTSSFHLFDSITFHSFSQLIQCSGHIFGES